MSHTPEPTMTRDDVAQMLRETDAGIAAIKTVSVVVPQEAIEMRRLMLTALHHMDASATLREQLAAWRAEAEKARLVIDGKGGKPDSVVSTQATYKYRAMPVHADRLTDYAAARAQTDSVVKGGE